MDRQTRDVLQGMVRTGEALLRVERGPRTEGAVAFTDEDVPRARLVAQSLSKLMRMRRLEGESWSSEELGAWQVAWRVLNELRDMLECSFMLTFPAARVSDIVGADDRR